jgi:putative DNA primase/helicase
VPRSTVTAHSIYDFLRSNALEIGEPIQFDGRIHRFVVGGAKRGKRNGWYWFVERNGRIYGTAGNWKTQQTVSVGRGTVEYRDIKIARVADDEDRARKAEVRAADEWASLSPSGHSDYLNRKRVVPKGVRFGPDYIAVPMMKGGKLVGLQRIYNDGKKRFTPGCAKRGSVHMIEGSAVMAFVEGYATGASVHMATGATVVVTFDCGNLVEVAKDCAGLGLRTPPMVCGDNDFRTQGNPGVRHAREAARRLKGKVVVPPERLLNAGGTDWNDVHVEHGIRRVAEQIYEVI